MEASFIQDTLTDNKLIFDRIVLELRNAKTEVLVAMAWFTDPQLYDILKAKLRAGVKVSIILSEQPDNEKLDFSTLESLGAEVVRVKNVGYGMMHQKFCIIDRNMAISGSYNWSVNARTNNHESVIFTNYEKTVLELTEVFINIRTRALRLSSGETLDDILRSENIEPALVVTLPEAEKPKSILEQTIDEFRDVLDTVIAAEVGNFDKQLLRETGYMRAKDNNGDHQVLPQAMDSVYSSFINEIEVIEDRKKRLVGKIDEQQRLSTGSLESKISFEQTRLNEDHRLSIENCKKNILSLESDVDNVRHEVRNNTEVKIPFLKEKINVIDQKISDAKKAFVKPAKNWPLLIICGILISLLTAYIFMFYSSVAYILIFSKQDAKLQAAASINIETPEVFDPKVFIKIGKKGLGGFFFIMLFVAIPYCLGLVKHFFEKPKWIKQWGGLIGIVIIDIIIAFKVARNINHVELLTNDATERLSFSEILLSDNFLLVFVLGTLGVFLFKIVAAKLLSMFDERSATVAENQNKIKIEELHIERNIQQEEVNVVLIENNALETKIAHLEREIEKAKFNQDNIPIKLNDAFTLLKQELEQGKERLANLASIYKSYIENDKLPISVSALADRINVFLEGWSKYLHDTYSMIIAERKTAEAIIEIDTWKSSKLSSVKLDS